MENGIIYKITNNMNGKVYIGQTTKSLIVRWNKHKSVAKNNNQGLYGAIQKYGIENFSIEEILRCSKEELNELEIYYIQKYDSFNDGYNRTIGGGNAPTNGLVIEEDKVIELYQQLKTMKEIAEIFNCCSQTISNILNKYNIKKNSSLNYVENFKKNKREHSRKKIYIVELKKDFESLLQCGQWLIDNEYSKASTADLARKSISRVLTGERQTYCKMHFEYL